MMQGRLPRAVLLLATFAALMQPMGTAWADLRLAMFATPYPDDDRCGQFGLEKRRGRPLIPVALVIMDLTLRGQYGELTTRIEQAMGRDFDLGGLFRLRPVGDAPADALTWSSPLAFDYLGWQEAGVWMVIVGEVQPGPEGLLSLRFDAYLTEEGDVLRIGGAAAPVDPLHAEAFAHRFVNALQKCLTGVPGRFGTRIAYARRVGLGDVKEIFVTQFGSPGQTRVSEDGVLALLPAWAPGGALAFTGYRRGNPDVYVGDRLFSSRPGQNTGIAFSPDGRYAALTLAVDGWVDLYLVDGCTGEEVARLTKSRAIDTSPSWSPDGRRMVFVSDRDGNPNLWMMNADGSEQRPLSLPGSYNTSPDWSADGFQIVYQSRGENGRFAIWKVDLLSGAIERLSGGAWDDEEPSFSPDGRMIVFTSTRRGPKLLFVMSEDGDGAVPLFEDGGDYFTPAWEKTIRNMDLGRPAAGEVAR